MSQSTDQILTRFLGVKCSSFQVLSRAMKFGNCVCVCEARDDEEEMVVFRLRFPIDTFYSLLVISFSQHQLVKTEEPDMKHKKILKDETPRPPGDSHISDLKSYKVNICKY